MSARRIAILFTSTALVIGLLPGIGLAHEERESRFPPGDGEVPVHRSIDEASDVLVVCKPGSAKRIKQISDPQLRRFNRQLLSRCEFRHMQAAVDAVERQRTNIYVLPGLYREQPSWDRNAPCTDDYDGGVVAYDQIVDCGEVVNLVTVAGDDPEDDDIVCDNQLCDLQISGTGEEPEDTELRGGFRRNGDWIKHNGIKADRADGFYLTNMAFRLFRENAMYVHETDGYVLDDVVGNNNDLYGILTFTSDHGLITDCETAYNGDSGVYPGSASDVNSHSTQRPPLQRWAIEITGCSTHHNALGFSGTAGNSVYFHDNDVFANAAGYVTDSFVPDHPGMPQDHAWLVDNDIRSNNSNFYENVQGDDAPCQADAPAERGYESNVVCPAFPVPVGTGVMIAGGNYNLVESNEIYDNHRQGVMLFWVPAALRGEFSEDGVDVEPNQLDTSHANGFVRNQMGITPDGRAQPNGVDFWWDDQGEANCWQDNLAAEGTEITHNAVSPAGLPDCDSGGSLGGPGSGYKSATLVPCATYDREDNPDPPGCDWFDDPDDPQDDGDDNDLTLAAGRQGSDAPTGVSLGWLQLTLLTIGLGGLGLAVRNRRRRGSAG